MEFVLRYRGNLPGRSGGTTRDKQLIRKRFHPQLRELCRREPFFQQATSKELAVTALKGRRLDPERPLGNILFHRVSIGDMDYVALVNRPHQLACELEILWLRHERPGDVVSGGDLDNRLKNLMDALRIPHDPSEVDDSITFDGDRCYCLLEDDALITKLTVNTHELLAPISDDAAETDVDLLLHVRVTSTSPMMGNIGLHL